MSKIKSPEDIVAMRKSGAILATVLRELAARVKPGVTTEELDAYAEARTRVLGGAPAFKGYKGFPKSICISFNEEIVHGIPGPRAIKTGDIVSLDYGVVYEGRFTDAAVTVAVGRVSPEIRKLIKVTRESLRRAIAAVRPGATTGDIGHAVEAYASRFGYGIVRDLIGHGVGHAVHEPPPVPNFGTPGSGEELVPGMAIAIEPMLTLGTDRVTLRPDHWTYATADGSLSAHFEHTVVVTETGHELITK